MHQRLSVQKFATELRRRYRKWKWGRYFTEVEHGVFIGKNDIAIYVNDELRKKFLNGEDIALAFHQIHFSDNTKSGNPGHSETERTLRNALDLQIAGMIHAAIGARASENDAVCKLNELRPHINVEVRLDAARKMIPNWTKFNSAREFNETVQSMSRMLQQVDPGGSPMTWEEQMRLGIEILDALQVAFDRCKELESEKRYIVRSSKKLRRGVPAGDYKGIVYGWKSIPSCLEELIYIAAFSGINPTKLWPEYIGTHEACLRATANFCQVLRNPSVNVPFEDVLVLRQILKERAFDHLTVDEVKVYSDHLVFWINHVVGVRQFIDAISNSITSKEDAILKID